MLRILLLLTFAALLTGCGSIPAGIQTSERPLTAAARPEATAPRPRAPKPAIAATASDKSKSDAPSPTVGSPEWEKQQAENERKEQRLKQTIQNICRGC